MYWGRRGLNVTLGAAALAMGLALGGHAKAMSLDFVFDTGGADTAFDPLSSAQTGAQFYNYSGSEATVPFALTTDRAHVFLHRNTSNNDISLGVILDSDLGGGGGGNARLTFGGLPGGTTVLVLDDPTDAGTHTTTPPTAVHDFIWSNGFTDGIVLGNFTSPFEITLDLSNLSGISSWAFYSDSGNGNANPLITGLGATSNTLTITATTSNDIPEPGTLLVLGIGLAGLGWMRRRGARRAA